MDVVLKQQRTLTYFVGESIIVCLLFSLTELDSTKLKDLLLLYMANILNKIRDFGEYQKHLFQFFGIANHLLQIM